MSHRGSSFSFPSLSNTSRGDEYHITDKTRSRSGKDRMGYIALEEKEYTREQCRLYPPDGYQNVTSSVKKPNGKKGKVTRSNREYPEAYTRDYDRYNDAHTFARATHEEYLREKQVYTEIESKTSVPAMYYHRRLEGNERSGIFYPKHHAALRAQSDKREEAAYG